jgi:hypothetical protein
MLPYENATSGKAAVAEMQKILKGFGAQRFGVMEDFEKGAVTVQFVYRDTPVTITASYRGYAVAWLKHHPRMARSRTSDAERRQKAEKQAGIAVYSILRDWIKGQVTAVDVGMLSFEGAFLGQILLASGETVLERIEKTDMLALPKPAAA